MHLCFSRRSLDCLNLTLQAPPCNCFAIDDAVISAECPIFCSFEVCTLETVGGTHMVILVHVLAPLLAYACCPADNHSRTTQCRMNGHKRTQHSSLLRHPKLLSPLRWSARAKQLGVTFATWPVTMLHAAQLDSMLHVTRRQDGHAYRQH